MCMSRFHATPPHALWDIHKVPGMPCAASSEAKGDGSSSIQYLALGGRLPLMLSGPPPPPGAPALIDHPHSRPLDVAAAAFLIRNSSSLSSGLLGFASASRYFQCAGRAPRADPAGMLPKDGGKASGAGTLPGHATACCAASNPNPNPDTGVRTSLLGPAHAEAAKQRVAAAPAVSVGFSRGLRTSGAVGVGRWAVGARRKTGSAVGTNAGRCALTRGSEACDWRDPMSRNGVPVHVSDSAPAGALCVVCACGRRAERRKKTGLARMLSGTRYWPPFSQLRCPSRFHPKITGCTHPASHARMDPDQLCLQPRAPAPCPAPMNPAQHTHTVFARARVSVRPSAPYQRLEDVAAVRTPHFHAAPARVLWEAYARRTPHARDVRDAVRCWQRRGMDPREGAAGGM
ncbi:uncharacterized protein FIBRA_07983 [Fibroporia radiculosa]|uniref:Uncharacterized protein n=1 Tax=Fibroporia radiculosa TaxID=599839 RepID=J4IC41_9APHY|nr:uncharacterized protein FIBRA_07983 [Fibroporia radiculosa]CCM05751.1 predicted protein [Fibroporia radiculosa]